MEFSLKPKRFGTINKWNLKTVAVRTMNKWNPKKMVKAVAVRTIYNWKMVKAVAVTRAPVMKAILNNEPLKIYLMMKKTSWRIPVRRMEEMMKIIS